MKSILILCILLITAALHAEENHPIAILETLIAATEKSLTEQKALRELVLRYQEAEKKCLQDANDDDALIKLVKAGHVTLQAIKEAHLMHSFTPEFISELNRFSQVATKRGVPKS